MVFAGEELLILVETAVAGTFIEIADLNRVQVQTQRDRTTYAVFQNPAQRSYARATRAVSLQGFLNGDDAGQVRLRLAEKTEIAVKVRLLPDGTNGEEYLVRIHAKTYDVTADPSTLQPVSYECDVLTDPVDVGTGLSI
jgi:hypothetical protein